MKYLVIFFFFCYCNSSNTQENITIKSYSKKFDYHIERYQDSAKIILNKIENMESTDISVIFYKNYLKGIYLLKKEENLKALNHFNYLDSLLSKEKNTLFYLKNKIKIGVAYKKNKEATINLKSYFKKLLLLADSIKDTKSNIKIKLNLAKIYSKDSLFKAQETYYSLIENIEGKKEFEKELAHIYASFGDFYNSSRNFDPNNKLSNAKRYYSKAINLAKKNGLLTLYYNTKLTLNPIIPSREEYKKNTNYYIDLNGKLANEAYNYFKEANDFLGQVNSLFALGNNKRWLGDVKGAIVLWKKAYHLSADKNYELGQQKMSKFIIAFSLRLKDFDTAEQYAFLMYNKSKNSKNFKARRDAELNLTDLYIAKKDYQKALKHSGLYWTLKDSIANREDLRRLNELETKYQTTKKEQEIALLKSQNETIEQQKKNQRNLLLSATTIATIVGFFLYFLYRNRQKTNTKLKELDKVKSNFFANISHEFRTPLTLISNPIEITLEDYTITDQKRQQFETAKRNCNRLLSLVNQLLDLSRIDAGKLKLHIQKSNVTNFIAALSESFSFLAKQKNINYSLIINKHTEDVYFDKDAIEKIVVNLLSNAIKYTPENGSVSCNVFIEKNTFNLKVKNSGEGLSEVELKHVFQRFYQSNEQNQGAGIGLALVKELVDLHKGKIYVESELNKVTTFTVMLPVDKQSFKKQEFLTSKKPITILSQNIEEKDLHEDEEFIDTEHPILLIVEDNDDVRTLLKQIFKPTYNIIVASNGEKGIELALEHIPDLIISDIMMPVKDGIELTKQLKNDERTSHIPIILLTAKAGDENKLAGLKVGADDYITKPFNSKLLITKAEKLIENRRLLQKRYSQELVLFPKDLSVTNIDEQFLEKIQTILDENLLESSFSIAKFSEAAGMSRMQLHRKLKALTGLTATEFIRSQRLKLAAKLLQSSDINISQVGYSVGFNDHSYFAKCFKDTYKCTPTEYAKRKS